MRLGAGLLLVPLAGACAEDVPAHPSVLLVTIDTLRADHVHALGYALETTPRLDALAAEGALFTQAISHAPETVPAHASLLTGLHPPAHTVHSNGIAALPQELTTVPELASAAGHRTAAFVGSFVLSRKFGLDQGFQVYDDSMGEAEADPEVWYGNVIEAGFDRPAGEVTDAALAWLEQVRDEPFFLWVHYYDPHAPYEPPPEYDVFPRNDRASTYAQWEELWERLSLEGAPAPTDAEVATLERLIPDVVSLYDGEIRYADAQLGRLLDALERQGRSEDTLVVVTSDHGESLGEDTYYFRHGWYLRDNVLRVPLVVRYPGRVPAGSVIAEPVELVDLFRTMGAVLPGLDGAHDPPDGRDLVALAAARDEGARGPEYVYSETFLRGQLAGEPPMFSLRSERWLYVDNLRDGPVGERSLFDLREDPLARRDRLGEQGALAEELRARLRGFLEETWNHELADESRIVPDEATLERLRALGYVR